MFDPYAAIEVPSQGAGAVASVPEDEHRLALLRLRDAGLLTEEEHAAKLALLEAQRERAPSSDQPAPAVSKGQDTPGNTWRLREAHWKTGIGLDPMPDRGFGGTPRKEVAGLSMLVPTEWSFACAPGEYLQTDDNLAPGRLNIVALSPEKTSGFLQSPAPPSLWCTDPNILGMMRAEANGQGGPVPMPGPKPILTPPEPLSARLPMLLRQMVPTAQIQGEMQPIPGGVAEELARGLEQANQQAAAAAAQFRMPPPRLYGEAGRLRFTNTDEQGTGEGWIYAVQLTHVETMPNGAQTITTKYPTRFLTVAPLGELDRMEPLFTAMGASIRLGPEFEAECRLSNELIQIGRQQTQAKIAQIHGEINADNLRHAIYRGEIMRDAANYRNDMMNRGEARRAAAVHHSAEQFRDYLAGESVYRDNAAGFNVRLPSGYDHVWASTVGATTEYILTDSAAYDPNGRVGSGSWAQLQVQR